MRLCNEPTPRNGGKNCDENKAIEILNCEVHGGWTHWSAWSACKGGQATNCEQIASSLTSKTQLESAIRTRTRTCTNPEPKFNGRLCVGLDQEEEVCTPEMINPCSLFLGNSLSISNSNNGNMNSITNNQWTSWGPWEECSKTCGEGFQMRRRSCNGKLCIGCNQEWRTCNSEPCKERVETIITVWDQIEANKESNQKLEKRFKFLCKYDHYLEANNMDGMELNSSTEYRLCEDEKFCRSIKSLKELGVFSAWGEWSACKSCSDIQFRTRKCNVVNTCFGHERETRDCDCSNLNKEDHGWSCWSDFGACSSNCGKGVHRRTRKCLANNYECIGPREEITTCFNANCSGFESN
jgi:semaphorin 5